MVSDAFHIYPTDGKVNGQRSNFPYGECANGTTLPSCNGVDALGKLGKSTFPGYSGTVFEPVDEYKGDFARSYFYMAACYNDKIASWSSPMLAGNSYPCYTTWAVNLLLKWNEQDPVSQKEIDRNNAVYKHQNNRNPFIDHPEPRGVYLGRQAEHRMDSGRCGRPEDYVALQRFDCRLRCDGCKHDAYLYCKRKGGRLDAECGCQRGWRVDSRLRLQASLPQMPTRAHR